MSDTETDESVDESVDEPVDEPFDKIIICRIKPRSEQDAFYRCTWPGKFLKEENEELKSPKFTIPGRDFCKWYMSVQHLDNNGQISFSTRLYLDPESECKAVVAKFRLQVGHSRTESARSSLRTFEFLTKSENSTAVMLIVPSEYFQRYYESEDEEDKGKEGNGEYYALTVLCTIMIVKVIPAEGYSLPEDFKPFFQGLIKNGKGHPDSMILAGPYKKQLRIHKGILAARSSVFNKIFTKNQNEVHHIKNYTTEVVVEMLRYIYTGEASESSENAGVLLKIAHEYGLIGLKRKCEGVLIESLSNSNAFDLLSLAVKYEATELNAEAVCFIWRKKTELMNTSGWESLSKTNPKLLQKSPERYHRKPSSSAFDTDDSFQSMPTSGCESKETE